MMTSTKTYLFAALLFLVPSQLMAAAPQGNLLRNGSFEGGRLYWHNLDQEKHTIVTGGKHGSHAMRITAGSVMSAPFVAEKGESFTVSMWVKAEKPTRINVQMPPSAREVGTAAKRLWMREGTQSAEVGTEWSRVTFTWQANVDNDGFWRRQHYLIGFSTSHGIPLLVDGVTVTRGDEGSADYVAYRPLEVVAECLDWPGFAGATANLFEPGAEVRVVAHAFNPTQQARRATVRWQLFDYEGQRPLSPAQEKDIELAPLQTQSLVAPLQLTTMGCVLARVSIESEGQLLDSSELPLTTLPYAKSATKPDYRERFGGSFAGGIGCVQKFQKLGFGWIRWRPHSNGHDHLPVEPKEGEPWQWTWFDEQLDEQEALGCSSHLVLYPPPKWIMEKGHPLPRDMRWKADDPRWQDLTIETVWDKFVKEAVAHYKGRSVIFEIENEPEFDRWLTNKLGGEYAQFTLRTAKLIKQTWPEAPVMINNVYGIPSAVNSHLLKIPGWHKNIDVISWHDYHAGWLDDAQGIRRKRQNIDEAGGKHVELWFNEGWAFTNTAVDEPIACTSLTSAQSTNAIMASVAEMSISGQKKTILFHTTYETHGMSFWDYSGPGTMLWDWYDYPLPLVAAWNVMAHHIGISDEIGFIRPAGANFALFHDLRNERPVVVAYADKNSQEDVMVKLPAALVGKLVVEDIMGNVQPLEGDTLTLAASGRVVYLYDASNAQVTPQQLFDSLEPLDRKYASFVISGDDEAPVWRLPSSWEGEEKGTSKGSVAVANGQPIWRLEQLWPTDPRLRSNYRPLIWDGTEWNAKADSFGGQPEISLNSGVLKFGTRAPHGKPMRRRTAALTFIAPQDGTYRLRGNADTRMWDSKNTTNLVIYHKSESGVSKVASRAIAHDGKVSLNDIAVPLEAADELALIPEIEGSFAGGTLNLREFSITLGEKPATVLGIRLPAVWEGKEKGSSVGNPIQAAGEPMWRLDQLLPKADPILPASYKPLVWNGTQWNVLSGGQGGQPGVTVSDGTFNLGMRGPWSGPGVEHEKTAALVFIAPVGGHYKIEAKASTKKWEGGAEQYALELRKRDTQRVAELKRVSLAANGTSIPLEYEVELSQGHELLLLFRCPTYNNGVNCKLENLVITQVE